MIALGLQLRNARIPQTRNPIASTPFVLKLHRAIGYLFTKCRKYVESVRIRPMMQKRKTSMNSVQVGASTYKVRQASSRVIW